MKDSLYTGLWGKAKYFSLECARFSYLAVKWRHIVQKFTLIIIEVLRIVQRILEQFLVQPKI